MIGQIGLSVVVANRSLTTTPGDVIPVDIASRLASYDHTITATGGFESCTLTFPATDIDEAQTWADRLLCPITVYGPDADVVWDGYISAVELRVGSRVRSYSLEALANRVRARYTTVLGTPGATATAQSDASRVAYGFHDYVLSLGTTTLASAQALRDAWLARYDYPRAVPQTTVRTGGDGATVEVTLTCAGWYYSLDWVVLERADTSNEVTTVQIAALLGAPTPGINSTNAFLGTTLAAGSIATSGVSTTRRIEADTTYRAAIEQRLGLGDTAGQRFAWGVFDTGRQVLVKQWAGADPATIAYRVRLADATVLSSGGGGVELWQVRPDAMVEDVDLIPVGPPSGAVETPAAFYIERVSFRAGGDSLELTLEPEASSGIDARIARIS